MNIDEDILGGDAVDKDIAAEKQSYIDSIYAGLETMNDIYSELENERELIMKCTECNGTGKSTITVSFYGTDKPDDESIMPCFYCDGTGKMTQEDADNLQAEKDAWCTCPDPFKSSKYYADGEHPELHKHHYRCKACGKITQIG